MIVMVVFYSMQYIFSLILSLFFAGNRKALVEKSGLVKHATNRKQKEMTKQTSAESRSTSNR